MEQWRAVAGAEGLYEVSNLGRVRSLNRTYEFYRKGAGMVKRTDKGQLLNQTVNTLYPKVQIRYHHQKRTSIRQVHRIVAETFIDNPKGLPFVNHIDGDKYNANVNNLEWVTHQENVDHAKRTGLNPQGEDRSNALLNEELVRWIRKNAIVNGGSMTYVEMAEVIGVSRHLCSDVARYKRWKHIN